MIDEHLHLACSAGSYYITGRKGLNGLEYAGTATGSALAKKDRLQMVERYLLTLAASGVILHSTIIGIIWMGLDPSSMSEVFILVFVLLVCASFLTLRDFVMSDLDLEAKRKPAAVPAVPRAA